MANVRAFVAPSLWYEPFGIVAIESLAVGTPILVSAIGGLSEIVKKSGGGLTFTPGNADALAQAMTKLFDHAQYEELVQKGKKYVEREHAPETFVKNVLKEYEAVL
jgi:glycosyltransferase involved in cell wall biosynthesis